jgi:hypothetical protein
MRPQALAGFLAVACAVFPLPLAAAQTQRPALDEILKNPKRYDGRIVRLRGQIDNCHTLCGLCPEAMTANRYDASRCISIGFGTEAWDGKLTAYRAGRAFADVYRFATVTIEARFSSACLAEGNTGACILDSRPPNLREARVLAVHARKSARDGLADEVLAPVVNASPEEREAMLAALNNVVPGDRGLPEVFVADPPDNILAELGSDVADAGLGCVCLDGDCADRWPARLFTGMESAGNPFRCWEMLKTDKGWRVIPDSDP